MDGRQGVAHRLRELGDLEAGIGAVAAAIVEEVADVVSLEHFDQAFVFGAVRLDRLELVATGAKSAPRCVAQRRDGLVALLIGIDQVFHERADDAVVPGIEMTDAVRVAAAGLDHATGAGVDDGGNATGLGVKGIMLGHIGSHLLVFGYAGSRPLVRRARTFYRR